MTAPGFDVRFQAPAFTIGVCGPVLVWCFRGQVTLDPIKRGAQVHAELCKAHPKMAVLTIIAEGVPLAMGPGARELSTAITTEYRDRYAAISDVIEGSGFWSATARSVVAGIRLVARPACPAKVFGDSVLAARWMAPLVFDRSALVGGSEALERACSAARVG